MEIEKSEKISLEEDLTEGNKLRNRLFLEEGENLEEPVICTFCKGILIEPRNCSSCEKFYCRECMIKKAEVNENKCDCGKTMEDIEPHKLIKKILNRLKFRCLNENKGCNEKIYYNEFKTHLCNYETVNCENEFCSKNILRLDYEDHIENCDFKKVICNYCKNGFFLCTLLQHESTCEKKPLLCSGCEKEIFQNEFKLHYEQCEFVKENCEECLTVLRRNEKSKHTREKCLHKFYLKTKKRVNTQLNSLQKMIAHLNKRLGEQEIFFGTRCDTCNKYACEVSRRICDVCKQNYCFPCSRKKIKSCRFCEATACSKCFAGNDICDVCYKKRKTEGSLVYNKENSRKGKRGRPRKSNIDSFIID